MVRKLVKRYFDIIFSIFLLILFIPLWIIIPVLIKLDSSGRIIFKQKRVGLNSQYFTMYKLRTMKEGVPDLPAEEVSDHSGMYTKVGVFLRRFSIDEIPQLINILKGDMSFVGPRPEVRKYVELYNERQKQVLKIKPGLTDYASLEYINESEILSKAVNPEKVYIEEIMPSKLELNLKYITESSIKTDMKIIYKTLRKILY